jgi:hypothetical protein
MNKTAATVAIETLQRREVEAWDESAIDEIQVLRQQESAEGYAVCGRNYLLPVYIEASETGPNSHIDENLRRKVCEWSFKVVDEFGFDREVVSIALNYLDRYVTLASETTGMLSKIEFQLVAVTALYLAIKLHGEIDPAIGPRRKLKIETFVKLNGGCFSVEILENMEKNMLSSLNWRVNPPTTVTFIANMLRLLPKWSICGHKGVPDVEQFANHIFALARHLAELSVGWSSFTFRFKPSAIAYACILSAIDVGTRHSCPLPPDVRDEFLLRIAQATSLVSSRPDVRELRWMFFHHFPSMFDLPPQEMEASISWYMQSAINVSNQDEVALSTEQDGKASPVCVCKGPQDSPHRKRSRTSKLKHPSHLH